MRFVFEKRIMVYRFISDIEKKTEEYKRVNDIFGVIMSIRPEDELKKFNVILANPPYSIKRWDRSAFENDPYGRNMFGTPPQGCADYAFEQHILKSLDKNNGRSVVLWPHGVLFRDQEKKIRKKIIESDLIEAVIGLGPNLFYNSPMEACLLICKTKKTKEQKGKILLINAVNEVRRANGNSQLTDEHINKIYKAYKEYEEVEGFSRIISNENALKNDANLTISLYISNTNNHSSGKGSNLDIESILEEWVINSTKLKKQIKDLI